MSKLFLCKVQNQKTRAMEKKRGEKKKSRRPSAGPTIEDLSDHSTQVELTKDTRKKRRETEVDSVMDNVVGAIESAQVKSEKPTQVVTDTK